MNLCAYRDALGVPGAGFHRHFAGIAVGDLLGTIGLAAGAAAFYRRGSENHNSRCSFVMATIVAFIILMTAALVLHRAFCVDTVLTRAVFGPRAEDPAGEL